MDCDTPPWICNPFLPLGGGRDGACTVCTGGAGVYCAGIGMHATSLRELLEAIVRNGCSDL